MPSLAAAAERFDIPLTVIEGGSGSFHGVIVETSQTSSDSRVFSMPRRILRVRPPSAVEVGMVVRTPMGEVFIVADNGGSEVPEGALWRSYKLFRASHQARWTGKGTVTDPVTSLQIKDKPIDKGLIWVAVEPAAREAVERHMHVALEEAIFIAGAAVQTNDMLDGRPVVRSETQLGVSIGVIR